MLKEKIHNINEIKTLNSSKWYFFSPDTMKFFNSELESGSIKNYFVTSERYNYNDNKKYTIRKFDPITYNITTVGEFQGYNTKGDALDEIYNILTDPVEVLEDDISLDILSILELNNFNDPEIIRDNIIKSIKHNMMNREKYIIKNYNYIDGVEVVDHGRVLKIYDDEYNFIKIRLDTFELI